MPLITKADGTKFGKSESGTVWLDASKTSPYDLYQFLFNTDDRKVIEYLKKLTFLTREQIEELEVSLQNEPHKRLAQKTLASEVVRDLHGQEGLDCALKITEALFKGKIQELTDDQKLDAIRNMEKLHCEQGKTLLETLVESGIASSRREAREWIKGNSIMVNGTKITDPDYMMTSDNHCVCVKNYSIIRRGKKNYYCLELK